MITVAQADFTKNDLLCPADAMIVDPPYSEKVHAKAMSAGTNGRGPRKRDLGFGHLTAELRSAIALEAMSTRRWSAVFSDMESGHLWRGAVAGIEYVRTVPWVRWSQPQLSGDRPPSGSELVTFFHPKVRKHWNGPGSLMAFDAKALRGANKYSCEKPLDLMMAIVSWFSDPGDIVLDPCCGAGTTGLACRLLGREAVLLDISEAACIVAQDRVTGPLSARDSLRVDRWIEMQRTWLTAGDVPKTKAGEARYARAVADLQYVRGIAPTIKQPENDNGKELEVQG